MSEWSITIRVWPYSTRDGAEKDSTKVGPEFQKFHVPVLDDFKMASRFADAIAMGIRCNPAVWQANVVSVTDTVLREAST